MRFLTFLALSFTSLLCAQSGNILSSEVKQAFAGIKNDILRSAEMMPEENYSFKPAPRVRTFGQLLGHIAEENHLYCGTARGQESAVDVEKSKTSKADILGALRESFAFCDAVYDNLTDVTATELAKGSARGTRLRILWMNVVHDSSHYGNIVTYLRIKGLVPPSTEGQ